MEFGTSDSGSDTGKQLAIWKNDSGIILASDNKSGISKSDRVRVANNLEFGKVRVAKPLKMAVADQRYVCSRIESVSNNVIFSSLIPKGQSQNKDTQC